MISLRYCPRVFFSKLTELIKFAFWINCFCYDILLTILTRKVGSVPWCILSCQFIQYTFIWSHTFTWWLLITNKLSGYRGDFPFHLKLMIYINDAKHVCIYRICTHGLILFTTIETIFLSVLIENHLSGDFLWNKNHSCQFFSWSVSLY